MRLEVGMRDARRAPAIARRDTTGRKRHGPRVRPHAPGQRNVDNVPRTHAQPPPVFVRKPAELPGLHVGHDAPALHEHHAVGHAPQPPEAVLRDQHGGTRTLQTCDRIAQAQHRVHIQGSRRFVEHVGRRAHRARRGHGHQLLLPSRKRPDVAVKQPLDGKHASRAVHAGTDVVAGKPRVLATERDLGRGVQVEELGARVLQHAAHRPRKPVQLPLFHGNARHKNRSRRLACIHCRNEAVNHARERCLPTARRPRDHHHFAGAHRKVDVVHRNVAHRAGIGRRVAEPRPFQLDDRAHQATTVPEYSRYAAKAAYLLYSGTVVA